MSRLMTFLLFGCLTRTSVGAEKAGLKVSNIDAAHDTTITVKKGVTKTQCLAFEIVSGSDDVSGDPEFDRAKAHASWKSACDAWKQSMREMNKDNQILTLNCNRPKLNKEADRHTYVSTGSYKIKVRVREKM